MDKLILMNFDSLSRAIEAEVIFFSSRHSEGFRSVSIDSRYVKEGA
jgi:hypothetical protein